MNGTKERSQQADSRRLAEPIKIELASQPTIDAGYQPEEWPTLTLGRGPDTFAVYRSETWGDRSVITTLDASDGPTEAWSWLNEFNYTEDVLILVGPGETPITLDSPVFEPNAWLVWQFDEAGSVLFVGKFWHRLSVMQVMKSILASGYCPVVATPYMAVDNEWDTDRVIWTSEAAASAESGPTDADESLEHLLRLAAAGRGAGASGAEKRARNLVFSILGNAVGLDSTASDGIDTLVKLIQANPTSGSDAVRRAIR